MSEAPVLTSSDDEIAKLEVSEDGTHWRPFDPEMDRGKTLHRRMEFAPPGREGV